MKKATKRKTRECSAAKRLEPHKSHFWWTTYPEPMEALYCEGIKKPKLMKEPLR